jgi:integrase
MPKSARWGHNPTSHLSFSLRQRLCDFAGSVHEKLFLKLLDLAGTVQAERSGITVLTSCELRTVASRARGISLKNSALKLVAPTEIFRTVAPTRRPNAELRTREHLTPGEVDTLIEAAKSNYYGHRDATMILVAFRHGLRAAEVCDLRWD